MSSAGEHYIPLRPADLVRKLGDEPSVTIFEREQFRQLCQLVEATIHHEYRSRLEGLKSAYVPFDPDDDAATDHKLTDAERAERCREFFGDFDALMTRANYRRLSREQIEWALRTRSAGSLRLRLNLSLFERLEVYVRGDCKLPERPKRRWLDHITGRRHAPATLPGYRRLAVIFRLKQRSPLTDPLDTRAVVLKLFKDIAREDIETLLPGADICIGPLEQAQIVVPTLSGLGLTLFKLTSGAAEVAFAGIYSLITFLALIFGAIGYGVKSFYGYLHTREKHQLSLTRNLYHQNLDNNAGVIHHLLAEAEEQEFREVMLAWWLLWRGGLSGATGEQIDAAAEQWLRNRCGIAADFEISDALAKLQRLGLATIASGMREHPDNSNERDKEHYREVNTSRSPSTGRWRAIPIDQALATLDQSWDEQFDYQRLKPIETIQPRIWRAAA